MENIGSGYVGVGDRTGLPIDIKDGYLTVASPYPLNLEVMDDIGRVSNLKLKPVLSSRSDIIKLLYCVMLFMSIAKLSIHHDLI